MIPSGAILDFDAAALEGASGDPVAGFGSPTDPYTAADLTIVDLHKRAVHVPQWASTSGGVPQSEATVVTVASLAAVGEGPFGIDMSAGHLNAESDGTWTLRASGDVTDPIELPTEKVVVLALSYDLSGIALHLDGVEVASLSTPIASYGSGGYLPAGDHFRVLRWDVRLTSSEILAASEVLLDAYTPRATIAWGEPLHDGGSPVTGYIVRRLGGDGVTSTRVGPDVFEVEMPIGGVAYQVVAVNAEGHGAPVEVAG